VLGVVFSLKRQFTLSFTGESCMGLSPLLLRLSFIAAKFIFASLWLHRATKISTFLHNLVERCECVFVVVVVVVVLSRNIL
jgi:hypothetical protein